MRCGLQVGNSTNLLLFVLMLSARDGGSNSSSPVAESPDETDSNSMSFLRMEMSMELDLGGEADAPSGGLGDNRVRVWTSCSGEVGEVSWDPEESKNVSF